MTQATTAVPAAATEQILLRVRAPEHLRTVVAGDAPRRFHASMPGYAPTRLHTAGASASRLGIAELLVKDESARLGLPSFKALGAFWGARCALAGRLGLAAGEGADFEGLARAVRAGPMLSLSAATDGNHGRAVARIARLLGLRASIYVPRGTAQARIAAIVSEGASVTVVDGGYDEAVRRSARDMASDCLVVSDTSWEGYEDVPAQVIEGYGTIFAELDEQLSRPPDVVVVPVGVGALAAAAVRHLWAGQGNRPRLVAVEPTSAACVLESVAAAEIVSLDTEQNSMMAGLNCATPSLVAWPLISQGMDAYLAVADTRVPEAMRLLARDGIVAGETGAAALAGMLRLMTESDAEAARAALGLGPKTRALVLCTEGATDPDSYNGIICSC